MKIKLFFNSGSVQDYSLPRMTPEGLNALLQKATSRRGDGWITFDGRTAVNLTLIERIEFEL